MQSTLRRFSRVVAAVLCLGAAACADLPAGNAIDGRSPARLAQPDVDISQRQGFTTRDLQRHEARGGHTLARHVGLSDDDLRARLAREPGIATASTYTDRDTAERTIRAALAAEASRVSDWRRRSGRRPNLALNHRDTGDRPIGRSLRRGERRARPCYDALVVLKWDDTRRDFFVLTSYPEARR